MNLSTQSYLNSYFHFFNVQSYTFLGSSKHINNNKYFFFQIYPILIFFFSMYYFFTYFSFYKYGFSYLPKKYKTFTVLRSPHIDKRSREQFHLMEYKCVAKIPIFLGVYAFYPFLFSNYKKGLKIYGINTTNR